jgi:hypothetical protein
VAPARRSPAQRFMTAFISGRYDAIFPLPRAGNTVPTSASSSRVHADTRIGAPLSCAPLPRTAVNSSSCSGSRTAACVTSVPCVSAMLTA